MAGRAQTIRLGLSRMERLYDAKLQPWKAIHVAGTNGKGSICAYLSELCKSHDVPHGRFTSPYVHNPCDSVLINGRAISPAEYAEHEKYVKSHPGYKVDPPSPFEMMTLVAFRAFEENNVGYGVVETGMGGRLDSTNVMRNKAVNVFSRIGMDHDKFLGTNLLVIAEEKAGIITTPGVPCVVDDTTDLCALDKIAQRALEMNAPFHMLSDNPSLLRLLNHECPKLGFAPHEITNLACAIQAYREAFPDQLADADIPSLLPRLADVRMPGRLQKLDVGHKIASRHREVLLDGAHNLIGMQALATHVGHNVRKGEPVTWVIGLSSPRDEQAVELVSALVRPEDTIVFTEYGAHSTAAEKATRPDPLSAATLKSRCERRILPKDRLFVETDSAKAIKKASDIADGGPLVITGSLYLGSEVLRWAQ